MTSPSPESTPDAEGPAGLRRDDTAGAGSPTPAGGGGPAVFRVPGAALVAAIFLALCLSPIAFLGGWSFALFALPLVLIVLILRVRTTVDEDGVRVRTLTTTRVPWSSVATLRLVERSFVRAVLTEGREVTLVNVRVRDLGRVGEASGGRIAVPSPAEAEAAQEHRRELEAARMRVARLRERQDGDDTGHAGATDPGSTEAGATEAGTGGAGEPTERP